MRRTAVAVVVALALASCSGSHKADPTLSGQVQLGRCYDSGGVPTADITITNKARHPSAFVVTVAFDTEHGQEQLATGRVAVDQLTPGQVATVQARAPHHLEAIVSCRLASSRQGTAS